MKPEELTAWALNELSPEEQARIEAALREDADVHQQAAQNKEFCDFLITELRDETMALSEEQRRRLRGDQAAESTDKGAPSHPARAPHTFPKMTIPPWQKRLALINLAVAAVVVAMVSAIFLMKPAESENRFRVSSPTPNSEMAMTAHSNGGAFGSGRQLAQDAPATGGLPPLPGAPGSLAPQPPYAAMPAPGGPGSKNATLAANSPSTPAVGGKDRPLDDAHSKGYSSELPSLSRRRALTPGSPAPGGMANLGDQIVAQAATASVPPALQSPAATPPPMPATASPPVSMTIQGGQTLAFTSSSSGSKDAFGNATSSGNLSLQYSSGDELTTEGDSAGRSHAAFRGYHDAIQSPANESYTSLIENTLTDVARAPLSTFSIDVDTASYANVRRFLNSGSLPPRDAVRIEELINYFPTSEEGPAADAKAPFAVKVEMAACPWQPQHRLARVHLKGRDLGMEVRHSNLVFLVDVSGSMGEPNKLPLVQKSLRLLVERLGEEDRVAMVTYAGSTRVVLASTNGLRKAEIMGAIDQLSSGGGTHGSAGIQLAYEQAAAGFIKDGVNRVILCTDGDFNVGLTRPGELEELITEKARGGVFLSVLGYGTGNLKDRTMETLADKGNGNYAYIDSLGEARKVLVEQMQGTLVTIAKDVKIQVEFNPAVVRQYRLIGYENRLLAKEDFNNDAKDAGEIGAGHSVTALYELVPASLPPPQADPVVDKLKYQPGPKAVEAPALTAASPAAAASFGSEAMTVKLRYKEPAGSTSALLEVPLEDDARPLDKAGAEFKFSAAVAGFGLLLRQSGYAGQLTWEQVRQLALEGKGADTFGYRGEFIQLIEKARGLIR